MGEGGSIEVKRRRHTPEQVVRKLREADRMLGEGSDLAEVARALEVSEATYWRACGGTFVRRHRPGVSSELTSAHARVGEGGARDSVSAVVASIQRPRCVGSGRKVRIT